MKKLLLYFLLFLTTVGCREKTLSPEELQPLVDKWRYAAYEKIVNGNKVWQDTDSLSPSFISFRFDGVVLDSQGLPRCCAPSALNINGKKFEIIPKAEVPRNPTCDYIDCIMCSVWSIDLKGDTFFLENCVNGLRYKYVRVN
jgi:hypothetical protein